MPNTSVEHDPSTGEGLLHGKRIVVTGASRGLGRAFAMDLAAHGADLVVNGTNAEMLDGVAADITALGRRCAVVVGTVADDEVAARIVATCVERYGGIDVAVNNAGIVRDRTLMKMTPEEFDEVVSVNLRGTWSVSRHAAIAMRESGGLLLQIVSNTAFTGSVGQTNYAASKAGVMGMLYAWDVELARFGIRTNALWPVAVTDMTQVVIDNAQRAATGAPAPSAAELGLGDPADVATVVTYLCSDNAANLRSQLITFNGSTLALWQHPTEVDVHDRARWTLEDLDAVLRTSDRQVHVPVLVARAADRS